MVVPFRGKAERAPHFAHANSALRMKIQAPLALAGKTQPIQWHSEPRFTGIVRLRALDEFDWEQIVSY